MFKWLSIVEQFAPTILMFTPAAPLAPFVAAGIHLAEQIPGASGAQKKAFAVQIAGLAANATAAAKGQQVFNDSQLENMVGGSIDLIVAAVNLVHRSSPVAAAPAEA